VRYEWDRRGVVRRDDRVIACVVPHRNGAADARVGDDVWHFSQRRGEFVATRAREYHALLRAVRRSVASPHWQITDGVHVLELCTRWGTPEVAVVRDGVGIGQIVPATPRRPYRPAFDTELELTPEEAAFVLWIAGDVRLRSSER
jgi:hypothetical protein